MLLFKFMLKPVGFEEIISAFTGEKHTHTHTRVCTQFFTTLILVPGLKKKTTKNKRTNKQKNLEIIWPSY